MTNIGQAGDDSPGWFKFRGGEFSSSPTFYTVASDRERALGRLQEMAGDPSQPAACEEQAEAREYLRVIIREDPELRERLRYYKQFVDAPNGKERLYKEVIMPKMFEKMRFRRTPFYNWDYLFKNYHLQFGSRYTVDYSHSPWFEGFRYHYPTKEGLISWWKDHYVPEIVFFFLLWKYTSGFWHNYSMSFRVTECIKRAQNSRRYYGRHVPNVAAPAHYVRNKYVLQAITRKMLREGKAHPIHVQQALNSLK